MAYLALYRKYRPLTFGEVVGQEFVTTALRNAVAGDRLAHAYLFSGPRGTGKTSTARIFARAINCLNPTEGEPCNDCANCRSILAGQWGLVEIDGASHNRVEDMRTLLDSVYHVPMAGAYNVYIIDEVHMLSNAAFNAFLKTLEEPPGHVKFILATTEPFKVPRTIHSRCQHYIFQSVPTATIADHVKGVCASESLAIDELSARLVAEAGSGSIRDALSVLDRVVAYCAAGITPGAVQQLLGLGDLGTVQGIVAAASAPDEGAFMQSLEDLVLQGHDLAEVTKSLLQYGRLLLFLAAGVEDEALLGMPLTPEQRAIAETTARTMGQPQLYAFLDVIAELQQQLKFDIDKRLGFELGLLQLRRTLQGGAQVPPANRLLSDTPAQPQAAPVAKSAPAPATKPPDDLEALAAMLDSKTGQKQAPQSPTPAATPRKSTKAAPSAPTATAPPGEIPIAPGQPELWTTFLRDCLTDHPAWVICLQGLVLVPGEPHHYSIDFTASHPIAVAWLKDRHQRQVLEARYHAQIGAPLKLDKYEPPVTQPLLAGMPADADWKTEAAAALRETFPDVSLRED